MSCHHLSTYERGRIEALRSLGLSSRAIARQLGRHRSCIDREIRRNVVEEEYQAEVAQKNYQQRRKHSRPKGKWDEGLANCIQQRLRETWSPEQTQIPKQWEESVSKRSIDGSAKANFRR